MRQAGRFGCFVVLGDGSFRPRPHPREVGYDWTGKHHRSLVVLLGSLHFVFGFLHFGNRRLVSQALGHGLHRLLCTLVLGVELACLFLGVFDYSQEDVDLGPAGHGSELCRSCPVLVLQVVRKAREDVLLPNFGRDASHQPGADGLG